MRKLIAQILIVVMLSVSLMGCGDSKVIQGKEIGTYGLFNQDQKYEDVEYRVVIGNVVWGILLVETIVAPIYFFGFSLFEPVGVDTGEPKRVTPPEKVDVLK